MAAKPEQAANVTDAARGIGRATVSPTYITGEVIDVDGGQWVN